MAVSLLGFLFHKPHVLYSCFCCFATLSLVIHKTDLLLISMYLDKANISHAVTHFSALFKGFFIGENL